MELIAWFVAVYAVICAVVYFANRAFIYFPDPRLGEVYEEKVQQLETSLNDPAIRIEAADALRALIERIELYPGGDGPGLDAVLHGDLAQILALCQNAAGKRKLPKTKGSGSLLSVVAGARFAQERTKWTLRRSA